MNRQIKFMKECKDDSLLLVSSNQGITLYSVILWTLRCKYQFMLLSKKSINVKLSHSSDQVLIQREILNN